MKATALSRAEMEANHAREAARDGGGLPAAPPPANLAAVESLAGGEIFNHRGTLYWFYSAPSLPGLRHAEAMERLQAVAEGDPGVDEIAATRESQRLLRRYARPLTWWGWLPWWLRRDPFRTATTAELGALNALFTIARMRCDVRLADTTARSGRGI